MAGRRRLAVGGRLAGWSLPSWAGMSKGLVVNVQRERKKYLQFSKHYSSVKQELSEDLW